MERKNPFVEGEFYHLYNRGVEKRAVFTSTNDYKRFLMLLYLANSEHDIRMSNILKSNAYEEVFLLERGKSLVALGAFCLMPNHFHILTTPLVRGGVSRYMLKVQTVYSMYFNTKNKRSGSLFQGPFKSVLATSDQQLEYLFAYIHLNPAKLKDPQWKTRKKMESRTLSTFVESYPYSSYGAYLSGQHIVTDPSKFPDYFTSKEKVRTHITDWLFTQE